MATYTPDLSTILGNTTTGTTAGDTPTVITPNVGGDSIALQGRYTVLIFITTGTTSTVTVDSVRPSDQGNDNNLTSVLPATGTRRMVFDASNDRFKQTAGNIGYVNLNYTSITGLTIHAFYI